MNPDSPGLKVPARLGPYRLDRLLGSGGMGAVWEAWDERLLRRVALKQIRAGVTLPNGRERLWREARAAARLNHPSIVHIYDILEGTDGDWIVMELVQGRTVRQMVDDEGALPPAQAVRLCREIAEGLAEAHAQGILHRDLKATNVIVSPSGHARILDFGLAKEIRREGVLAESQGQTITIPGNVLGTCYAMSPEQALGRALDERSDLFSLGSLLYEMLTGKAPFRAESAALSLARVIEFTPPPVRQVRPATPSGLSELIDHLLRKEPADRPRSAAEVAQALAASSGGEATVLPRPAPRPDEPTQATVVDGPQARRQSGGERRTITVACCAMVQLDLPSGEADALEVEALSEAAITFESLGREICRELAGSLGAALNRTLWLCFGYPQAHEDDAERAIRASRELQARFAALPVAASCRLAVRTGVHTGIAVVVSRPSSGPSLQPGDIFDIAMAIQGQMPAGRIGLSAASQRLLGRKFATHPLPSIHLKDLGTTVDVQELGSSLDQGSVEDTAPLINREAELQILLDRLRLACSGRGQAVLITGDAGIGKSRLVRALSETRPAGAATWLTAQGSAYTQNTPLASIVPLLARLVFADREAGSAEAKLHRLDEVLDEHGVTRDYAPLLAELLSLPAEERYPPLALSPDARRKRTLAAVVALLGAMAERRAMVLVIEDLHWVDPSTLELLDLLLGEISVLPLMLVATFRPELAVPWRHQTSVTQLGLGGLSENHAAQLIRQVAGRGLPAELHREIVVRTDGIPLFVEELTKAVLEAGAPLQAGIPFTLGASLLARLDRLGDAKGVAQLAAVIGRTFSPELLEALCWIKGAALHSALGRLVQAEILYRRGPAQGVRYIFKHALIQDAAYLSLLASDRQQLHRRLAGLLQEEFPAVAEAEPELMAHHCERGGLTIEAVDYLLGAGLRATQRSAQLEAMNHLNRALGLLSGLAPSPEVAGRELSLRSVLLTVLEAIRGWGDPEVAANAERCAALCRELGESGSLVPALGSLWAYHLLRADRQPTLDLANEIARLAETPAQIYMGLSARSFTAYYMGRHREALALAKQAVKLYGPDILPELAIYGDDAILMPYLVQSWTLWSLGDEEGAVRQYDAVLGIVETLGSPFARGLALLSEMSLMRDLQIRDPERLGDVSERLLNLAAEQEFAVLHASAHFGKGWAVFLRGDREGGTALIETGIELYEATGARLARSYWYGYLIEAHLEAGRFAEGLAVVRKALAMSETQLDVNCDAELLRLEGELLRASGDASAAELAFRKSLEVARDQGARAFALQSAASLDRLLAEQGRSGETLPPV